MRITCPACETAYEVPDRLIGAGRTLRCKGCRHEWHVGPGAPEPAPAAPPPPPPRFEPPLPLPTRPRAPQPIDPPLPQADAAHRRGRLALRAAWAASILVVAGMAAALWIFRAEVSEAWPPAGRLFTMVERAPGP